MNYQSIVYIEFPYKIFDSIGAFVYLEYDVNEKHAELRLLLDNGNELVSVYTHFDKHYFDIFGSITKHMIPIIAYLCDKGADISVPKKFYKKSLSIKKVGFSLTHS